jgi:hypothetical protein
MFLARRPTQSVIDRSLRESKDLPLSYGQPMVRALQRRFRDHSVASMKLATRSNGVRA